MYIAEGKEQNDKKNKNDIAWWIIVYMRILNCFLTIHHQQSAHPGRLVSD